MWRRLFVLCVVCVAILFADSAISEFDSNDNKIFELFADNIDSIDYKTVIATGNAVIINQDMYMIADYIKYNTESREANASGNVKFYRDGTLFFSAQQANIKFDEHYFTIEPFYMQDSESGMWISASFAENKDKDYKLKDVVVSSCDIDSPIWRIEGTSGDYNEDWEIAGIWNPRIYIKNIPILYFPYIFVSTKHKRTTGLLYPEFADSSLDGFIYLQPFFLALQDFWDMTFSPQIRTSRGYGIYTQTRIVDEYNRMFILDAGIFQNFKKYKRNYDAQNLTIFGFNFYHERRNLIDDLIGFDSDGLYLDFNYMNDLDYIRLQTTTNTTIENRIQTSKANYFGTIDDHYLGLYFKYFLDLSNVSNSDTMQTLPHFQYHKFLEQTDFKNLSYSIDVNSKNIMNGSRFGYADSSIDVPLYIQTSILSGYLVVGANADISANVINVYNANKQPTGYDYSNGSSSYFGLNYELFINSDIAKQYDKIFHSMSFGATFTGPIYKYFNDDNKIFASSENGLISVLNDVVQNDQQLQLKFSQYFFGLGGIELVYHRMYQDINPQDTQSKLGDLRNELGFSPISNIDIMTTLYYSWFNKSIEEASISLYTFVGYFKANLTYYLKKTFNYTDSSERLKYAEEAANFLRVKISNDFGYFALYGDIGYDFKRKYIRDWNITISKDIRCFGIGLRFANELTPILTTSGSRTINNRYISLEFRFAPVVSTSITHRFN